MSSESRSPEIPSALTSKDQEDPRSSRPSPDDPDKKLSHIFEAVMVTALTLILLYVGPYVALR